MIPGQGKVPIMESGGAAVRFVREQWRFILMVAAVGALLQGLTYFIFRGSALGGLLLLSAAIYAALVGAALHGPQGARARLGGDTLRVAASMAIVGFFMAIVAFVAIYAAMVALIAPFAEEVKAAAQDEAQMRAIMLRAVESQPQLLLWAGAIVFLLLFALSSRLYLAAPASVDQRRIVVFDSWRWTKGNMLRIAVARIWLLGWALLLVGALQLLLAAVFGAAPSNMEALMALLQPTPAGLIFGTLASFIQIGVYSALEAGLSTYLYRGLKPPDTSPGASTGS